MRKTAPKEEAAAGAEGSSIRNFAPEQRAKRDLEDLWKQVFPVWTEWNEFDLVYQYKWNFSNLEDAFEEGGELHGKKVYLFGSTELQLLFFRGQQNVTSIPVVVAVVSPTSPSDKIGIINLEQGQDEKILPLKEMKMDWVPYISMGNRDSQVERLKSEIFILRCLHRRADLHLKIEGIKDFEYRLPFFENPLKEERVEQSTVVDIMYPVEPNPVVREFDWKLDELEEFTNELVEKEELSEDQKDAFKEFVKEKVREAKKANREAREAWKKDREEMSEERKTALQNMKFYKFYPVATSDSPDVSNFKCPFINRYYGKAHQVL